MVATAAEHRFIMDQLGKQAQQDIVKLWNAASQLAVDFFRYVADAFPDIVIPYHQLASQIAATLFEDDFPDITSPSVTVKAPDAAALVKSAEWALTAPGGKALDRMAGTTQRHIYNGDRDTTVLNANKNGLRWIRVAQPDACAFCRLLATRRTNLYRSEQAAIQVVERAVKGADVPGGRKARGSQTIGDPYHDDCKCTAMAIPEGQEVLQYLYEVEPDAAFNVEQWSTEYRKARDVADSSDVKQILSEWRQLDDNIA